MRGWARGRPSLLRVVSTDFPGARLSHRLREKYPQEMTIVLQHQFWDLSVTEHTFEVGLSFSGVPERLLVPFDALTGFFDPSAVRTEVRGSGRRARRETTRKPRGRRAAPDRSRSSCSRRSRGAGRGKNRRPEDGHQARSRGRQGELKSAKAEKPAKADKAKDKKDDAGGTAEVVSLDSVRRRISRVG